MILAMRGVCRACPVCLGVRGADRVDFPDEVPKEEKKILSAFGKSKIDFVESPLGEPIDSYLAKLEKAALESAMVASNGKISQAAASLGIKRQTLQHKLKRYGCK